jgi:hypothetical protein
VKEVSTVLSALPEELDWSVLSNKTLSFAPGWPVGSQLAVSDQLMLPPELFQKNGVAEAMAVAASVMPNVAIRREKVVISFFNGCLRQGTNRTHHFLDAMRIIGHALYVE